MKSILVPDIGNAATVEVIEVNVKVGDTIEKEDTIVTLESDKASMEVPSSDAGVVKSITVKVGDKVKQGDKLIEIEVEGAEVAPVEAAPSQPQASSPSASSTQAIKVPDIGNSKNVEVIEIAVKPGDMIEKEDTLITLESDKASMEVPSPVSGVVESIAVNIGDKVNEGDTMMMVVVSEGAKAPAPQAATPAPASAPAPVPAKTQAPRSTGDAFASPAVRRLARELGIDLANIKGTGRKGRIQKSDLNDFIKSKMQSGGQGSGLPQMPEIDFSQFGEVTKESLSRINKLSAQYLHRNWVVIPHVTQFDEADITELEAFRKAQAEMAKAQGLKLTPLVFLMKAAVAALKQYPRFNSSLSPDGETLFMKKYFHIGVAVDTPNGLVVPVIRDVDKKGLFDLARELGEVSQRAREGKLTGNDLQGSCFTISSLGGIGGTAFTPIVNAPDVAILGVSRSQMKPVYDKNTGGFVPRLMLPLSLSYDHRVIDGAQAAHFTTYLAALLADIRRVLL